LKLDDWLMVQDVVSEFSERVLVTIYRVSYSGLATLFLIDIGEK
jgi:hypothetical protein